MYDNRNEPNEFVGDDLESAVAKAARFYELEEDELKVVQPAPDEVSGLAGRVVIVALPRSAVGRPRPSGGDDDRGERGGRGGRDRERGGRGDRGGRGRDRDRGGRGGRDRDRGRSETRGRDDGGRDRDRDRGRDRGADRERDFDREEERAPRKMASGPSKGKATGKLGPVGDFILGAVERMGLGSFDISEAAEGDFLVYQLTGEAAEALGEGDGRAVDALQLLANQASMRIDEEGPRVVVDAEGSGERRDQSLERLASRAAKRALSTGRAVALDPMNSRDRRAIHMAVREMDDVVTMSEGSGRYRQVVVVPEGAPEYDEAVEAQDSGRR